MLKNVTMGQYYPVDSVVHRLDPRVKLILTILFIVAVFMSHSFVGYILLLGFLIFACKVSNVPFRFLLKGLRPLRMIIVLTFLLNLFFTPGENLWISVWVIRIYREGFMQAVFYSLRLAFLVAGTSLLTLTTSPIALSDGIAQGIAYLPLEELMKTSDIISLHVPLTAETHHLISRELLEMCKSTAILINTARGNVVDIDALADLLCQGKLAGAGIDVFEKEPPLPADHTLLRVPNCVLVPHVGYATREAFDDRIDIVLSHI